MKTIEQVQDELIKQFEAKNVDYGNSFFETMMLYGAISVFVRLHDKFQRLQTLREKEAAVDEKIEDTAYDAMTYLAMYCAFIQQASVNLIRSSKIEEGTVDYDVNFQTEQFITKWCSAASELDAADNIGMDYYGEANDSFLEMQKLALENRLDTNTALLLAANIFIFLLYAVVGKDNAEAE